MEYERLPLTEEKAEISRQYLEDEICRFDFYIKAKEYLAKQIGDV